MFGLVLFIVVGLVLHLLVGLATWLAIAIPAVLLGGLEGFAPQART